MRRPLRQIVRVSIRLLCGDALEQLRLLPAESIQCCITSPPYWGLRSYLPDGHPDKPRELGLERTPEEYVAKLVEVFREVRRVLRDDGVVFLNLGDSYAGSGPSGASYQSETTKRREAGNGIDGNFRVSKKLAERGLAYAEKKPVAPPGLKPKDLVGIPWRIAFALQADDWWLRSDIIWSKPNPMPESVTDRPTKAHEYLFLLTKSGETTCWYHTRKRTWAFAKPDPDYVWHDHAHGGQERNTEPAGDWPAETYLVNGKQSRRWSRVNLWRGHDYYYDAEAIRERATPQHARALSFERETKEAEVPGQGYRQHRLGRSKMPDGWDTGGGGHGTIHRDGREKGAASVIRAGRNKRSVWTIPTQPYPEAHFATFPEALVEPCIAAGSREGDTVLDPFCGSGTVGVVCARAGRNFIGIDLNPEYVEMARRRIEGTAPLFVEVKT